jgi:hypothetical protein
MFQHQHQSQSENAWCGPQAMFGFASALIGEITTGRGALGQLQLETGLPPYGVDLLVSQSDCLPLL